MRRKMRRGKLLPRRQNQPAARKMKVVRRKRSLKTRVMWTKVMRRKPQMERTVKMVEMEVMVRAQRKKQPSPQPNRVEVVVGEEGQARPKKNQQSRGLAGGAAPGSKYSNSRR